MLQDQSRNRTPMPGAQAPGAAPPDTGPARAEAGIPAMLAGDTPSAPQAELPTPASADPVGLAIEAHRSARAALTAACNPADEVFVAQAGGDASDEAMAPARAIHEAASDAETDAWDALLETRPTDADGLLRMRRYIAGAGPMEVLGDAREFGRNIAEAAEAALAAPLAAAGDAELIELDHQAAAAQEGALAGLLRDLEACDRQRDALTEADDETPKDKALYQQHWDLLERIDSIPTLSGADLQTKARAAAISLKWDDRAECIGAGSFVSLAKQIVEGLGRQPAIKAARAPSMVDQILGCWREWSLVTDPHDDDDDHAALDRLNEQRDALLDAAEELPAELEHLPAKALALAWLEYVDLWRNGQARHRYGIDGRLVLDIDTAICGRLATGA